MSTTSSSTIQFIKRGKHKGKVKLNNILYTGFLIGKLPRKFAFIYDENEEKFGYNLWFNYKGLTYIHIPESPWSN